MEVQDYRQCAKENLDAFYSILKHFKLDVSNMSVDEIYEKFSSGNRDMKWSIFNFYIRNGLYYFYEGDISTLSGYQTDYTFELIDGEYVIVDKCEWMC